MGDQIQEAAKAIKWDVAVIDGKGTAQGWTAALTQAIALKPAAIMTSMDVPTVKDLVGEILHQEGQHVGALLTQAAGGVVSDIAEPGGGAQHRGARRLPDAEIGRTAMEDDRDSGLGDASGAGDLSDRDAPSVC